MTPRSRQWFALVLVVAVGVAGCAGLRKTEKPPDDRFGHRFEGKASDGRETIVIQTPEEAVEYVYFAAPHDTVHVRQSGVAAEGAEVEVLIKGAFPDACTELHSVSQERSGHILNVDLQMRRRRGVLCASVVRPYRFYLVLDGLYEQGHYTLKINGIAHAFVVANRAA